MPKFTNKWTTQYLYQARADSLVRRAKETVGVSVRKLARANGTPKVTISRELARNGQKYQKEESAQDIR